MQRLASKYFVSDIIETITNIRELTYIIYISLRSVKSNFDNLS